MKLIDYRHLTRSYARDAPKYDRHWRRYNDATLRATVALVPWDQVRRLLDVGCGTGLLEEAAQQLDPHLRVVGADISLPMLQQAIRKFEHRTPLSWANALAEDLPFASGAFDCIVCANCFHYFRRPLRALEEFRRVLVVGGQLVLIDWCHDFLACKICDFVLRVADRAHFRVYGLEQCEGLLQQVGFDIQQAQRFKIDWLWGLMAVRARV